MTKLKGVLASQEACPTISTADKAYLYRQFTERQRREGSPIFVRMSRTRRPREPLAMFKTTSQAKETDRHIHVSQTLVVLWWLSGSRPR